jgi:hypothetical protein
LLEQKQAMVCNQGDNGYATVTKGFGYEGADGQPAAEYTSLSSITDAFKYVAEQGSGLHCDYNLKP